MSSFHNDKYHVKDRQRFEDAEMSTQVKIKKTWKGLHKTILKCLKDIGIIWEQEIGCLFMNNCWADRMKDNQQ